MTMTKQRFGPFENIDQIKEAHESRGGYWFTPGAMRFFSSRLGKTVYGGRFFISSEQAPRSFDGKPSPRLYTVRVAHDDGTICTIDGFYDRTREQALRDVKLYVEALEMNETVRDDYRHDV